MKDIGFFLEVNNLKPNAINIAKELKAFLSSEGQRITTNLEDANICISIGGDGTFIKTSKKIRETGKDIFIFGINGGTLGYLTEGTKDNFRDKLLKIINSEYEIENRMVIDGFLVREGNEIAHFEALNDIVLSKHRFGIIRFYVLVDGEFLTNYTADGMICSTPTGSTSYALSAGGSIISPESQMIELVPLAPHTVLNRSIILPSNAKITLVLKEIRNDIIANAIFDGNIIEAQVGDKIEIIKSKNSTKVIRVDKRSFVEMISQKIGC